MSPLSLLLSLVLVGTAAIGSVTPKIRPIPHDPTLALALADAVVTPLVDGVTLDGVVEQHSYRYYSYAWSYPVPNPPYTPSDPLKNSLAFDLHPMLGDADLYVACHVHPTGDDAGVPSRATGHFNFSSAGWDEDALTVAANAPANCALQGARSVAPPPPRPRSPLSSPFSVVSI